MVFRDFLNNNNIWKLRNCRNYKASSGFIRYLIVDIVSTYRMTPKSRRGRTTVSSLTVTTNRFHRILQSAFEYQHNVSWLEFSNSINCTGLWINDICKCVPPEGSILDLSFLYTRPYQKLLNMQIAALYVYDAALFFR